MLRVLNEDISLGLRIRLLAFLCASPAYVSPTKDLIVYMNVTRLVAVVFGSAALDRSHVNYARPRDEGKHRQPKHHLG